MLAKGAAPRRAAERRPWWPTALAIFLSLLAVVLAVILIPRLWLSMTQQNPAPGSTAGSGQSTAASCDNPAARVAAPSGYSAAMKAAADAYNTAQGNCSIALVPYLDPAGLGELAGGENAPDAVLGHTSAAVLSHAFGKELSDTGTVAQTVGVVAVPETLVPTLGWTESPTWAELARTLPNAERWTAQGNPELGNFNVALADLSSSPVTRGFGLGLAAAALNKAPGDVTPEDFTGQRAQAALLGLVKQATVRANHQGEVAEKLQQADTSDRLTATVSAVVTDEQSVVTYHQGNPRIPLTTFYPRESGVVVNLNYLTAPEASDPTTRFGEFLRSEEGQAALKSAGLRGADGSAPEDLATTLKAVGEPAQAAMTVSDPVAQALESGWRRLVHPGRFLVLLDVSGSMAAQVPGTGRTKLQFAQDAATTGMRLVPPDAEIGVWEFATKIDGDTDYRELVPVGPVKDSMDGKTRLDALVTAVFGLTPRTDTALYDTALAGFRQMKATYSPTQPNVVVLITDGRNDDPGSISLQELVRTLQAEQDPERPVRFLTLAFGRDADAEALAQIAAATGGSAYNSPNPADIGGVFFQALMNG